jgi:hypothetical protein
MDKGNNTVRIGIHDGKPATSYYEVLRLRCALQVDDGARIEHDGPCTCGGKLWLVERAFYVEPPGHKICGSCGSHWCDGRRV